MPILPYRRENANIVIESHDPRLGILGESDYRSIRVPIGIYDEDRLRHMYVIGKTGVGKSKFLVSMMIDDIAYGKGIAVVDPHGDLIEEVMMHIPESRAQDVILFDPTDEQYPFSFNPLDIHAHRYSRRDSSIYSRNSSVRTGMRSSNTYSGCSFSDSSMYHDRPSLM
jgi:DNA helicase HerA-like ATPase